MLATMEEFGVPGALVLVDSPETGIWQAALGVADLESGAPMTTDMHMRVGSIAKTFTATMVLQLVDDGLITLDDTVAALLPDLPLQNAEAVTVRHLLAMQSGIEDYVGVPGVWDMLLDADSGQDYALRDMIHLVLDEPLQFEPGSQFMYSNTNYMIAAIIAEHVAGAPYTELIQANILDKVGLAGTSFPTTPDMPEPAPHGYAYPILATATPEANAPATPAGAGPADVTRINPTVAAASGATVSTLGDLRTWMKVLQEGSLLSEDMHAEQFDTSNAPEHHGLRYGLGVMDLNGARGHDGGIAGFGSLMLSFPETDTIAIVLVNALPTRSNNDPTFALLEHALGTR